MHSKWFDRSEKRYAWSFLCSDIIVIWRKTYQNANALRWITHRFTHICTHVMMRACLVVVLRTFKKWTSHLICAFYYSHFSRAHLHNMVIDDTDSLQMSALKVFWHDIGWLNSNNILNLWNSYVRQKYSIVYGWYTSMFILWRIRWVKTYSIFFQIFDFVIRDNITLDDLVLGHSFARIVTYVRRKLAPVPNTNIRCT